MTLKSRFAPSPTGLLHIGNARSAVLNWAHINSKGGEFILRIDDTDKDRSKTEFVQTIKRDLNWLGLTWSKTFNQSDRESIYKESVESLKASKRLYPCFESTEELFLKRKSLLTSGKPPIYDRSALKLSNDQINNLLSQGKRPHWRFELENKIVEWEDLIKGKVSFDSKNLSDPILIREDGSFLYHLPSVVDDIEEKITDIIRGEDHITNTAFHIQIFSALGASFPNFGHHPFLKDEKGKTFGKRLGSLSIQNLKKDGFENITLLNYLLSVGTSKDISKNKDINFLKKNFKIKTLASSSPKFSYQVLKSLNKDILQSYEFSEIKENFKILNIKDPKEEFWHFIKYNISFFSDIIDWWQIVNSSEIYLTDHKNYLKIAAELLPNEPYDITTWDKWTLRIKEKTEKKGKDLYMPLRLGLTGNEEGPELKYLMPLLKKEQILKKFGQ